MNKKATLVAFAAAAFIVPEVAFSKPPDWAPAHGYRRKHKEQGEDRRISGDDWKKDLEEKIEENFPGYKIFTSLDGNRDGRISRTEWNEGDDLFSKLDKNDDGYISRSEYGRIEEERGLIGNLVAKVKEKVVGFFSDLF